MNELNNINFNIKFQTYEKPENVPEARSFEDFRLIFRCWKNFEKSW